MAKFIRKPVIVEAVQWFKPGDHPDDDNLYDYAVKIGCVPTGKSYLGNFGIEINSHFIELSPGDWILESEEWGYNDVLKDDEFKRKYDPVPE